MKQLSFLKQSLSLFSLFLILLINSCAPVFSEMQSARTAGKNNIETTGSFSSINYRDTDEKENIHTQNHIGFQVAYGLSPTLDLRVRYAFVWVDEDLEDVSVNVFGIGPKFSLIKDRLSGYVPIGFAFGGDIENSSDTWQVHPTIIGTIPIIDKLEVNPSYKVLVPFNENAEVTMAFNLGLGINIVEGVTFRPEYGMLFNPGESGHFKHFSIGVTFNPSVVADKN